MADDQSETCAAPVLRTTTEIAEAGCRGGLITMEWMEEFEEGQFEWALAIDLSAISQRIRETRRLNRPEVETAFREWLAVRAPDAIANVIAEWLIELENDRTEDGEQPCQ